MHHTGLIYHSDCNSSFLKYLQLFLHYFFLNIGLCCASVEIVFKPTGTSSSDIWKFKLVNILRMDTELDWGLT